MTTTRPEHRVSPAMALLGRRIGHGFAILLDLLVLWIVDNLLAWDLVPFVTAEFADVSMLIMFSLTASMVAHAALLVTDRPRSGSVEQAVLAAINLWVAIEVLLVFPFDFGGSAFDWSLVARLVLIVAIVGSIVDLMTSLFRLSR